MKFHMTSLFLFLVAEKSVVVGWVGGWVEHLATMFNLNSRIVLLRVERGMVLTILNPI